MTAVLDPGRPFTGNERELLENTLDLNRSELVRAVDGLSDTQARERRVPSLSTPISLIKHCSAAERVWFQRTLAGMKIEECDGQATGGDGSFRITGDEETADERFCDLVVSRSMEPAVWGAAARDNLSNNRRDERLDRI